MSGVDQDNARISWICNQPISQVWSPVLIRRLWEVGGEPDYVEKAIKIWPSGSRSILNLPIPTDFIDLGLSVQRFQVLKLKRFKGAYYEPTFYVRIEVS